LVGATGHYGNPGGQAQLGGGGHGQRPGHGGGGQNRGQDVPRQPGPAQDFGGPFPAANIKNAGSGGVADIGGYLAGHFQAQVIFGQNHLAGLVD
jgi:hypothetical protein